MRRLLLLVAIGLAMSTPRSFAQQMLRNNFENNKLFWTEIDFRRPARGAAARQHRRSGRFHSDQQAEYLHLKMQTGKYLFYQYDVGKAPVSEELNA